MELVKRLKAYKGISRAVCLNDMLLALHNDFTITESYHYKKAFITVEDLYKQSFDAYFERLYSYAFTIVKNNDEAKDVVQTAFIKLWEKRNDVNIKTSARAYLYTSVYNLSLNYIRNRKTRESHHQELSTTESSSEIYSAEQKETRQRINNAIDSLPPRCKETFCKSRLEGKKYAEIASELNVSVKTVEVQMGKALKILRESLADLATIALLCFLF